MPKITAALSTICFYAASSSRSARTSSTTPSGTISTMRPNARSRPPSSGSSISPRAARSRAGSRPSSRRSRMPSSWARRHLAEMPLFIDDTPALSIASLRTRARRLKRQKGLDLIVVDYLQLMQANRDGRGAENRVQEISEITRGLKSIAKELNVPVLALSQLSRAVENREDKRPMLADLRESGSIEQDADVVMFIFREEYYLGRAEPMRRSDEA